MACFVGVGAYTRACTFAGRGMAIRAPILFPPRTSFTVANEAEADGETSSAIIEQDWKSKAKGSRQLNRWSRARALRCEKRRLGKAQGSTNITYINDKNGVTESGEDIEEENSNYTSGKSIYMVSDGTGWTAEHSVNAALGQFEHCLADRGCAVNTHLFSGIDEVDALLEIIRQAAKEEAAVLYTLADPNLAEAARRGCEMWGVPHTDILGPTTEAIGRHLGVAPLGHPRRSSPLSKQYFKRIEAVEFTIKQDDGALPQNLLKADLVLVGVSRTSKTPLSTYLAHKGYKVANVPLVLGLDPPKQLFETDQEKIYGLIINPAILQSIRVARAKTLGLQLHSSTTRTNYSEMDHIRQELDYAINLFAHNPRWPVIDVTGKAIEETAAVVLRIYHEKTHKYAMPRISKRY